MDLADEAALNVLREAHENGGGAFTSMENIQQNIAMRGVNSKVGWGYVIPENSGLGLNICLEHGWIRQFELPREAGKPRTNLNIITMKGYRKLLGVTEFADFAKDALSKGLAVLERSVQEQIRLQLGVGWMEVLNSGIPRDQVNVGLSYCLSAGWLEHADELKLKLTAEGRKQKSNPSQLVAVANLQERLANIKPGTEAANDYHDLCIEVLSRVFAGPLTDVHKETRIHNGQKRIDITFRNVATKGFFNHLDKHAKCPYIYFECKNYSNDPENKEYDQLTGRFSRDRGNFGILLCRSIDDEKAMLSRCKSSLIDGRGYVLVLTDSDLVALADALICGDQDAIDHILQKKLDALVLS